MRHCSKCNILKSFTDFRFRRPKSKGLESQCRQCEYVKYYQWRFKNKDKVNLRSRLKYKLNSEKLKQKSRGCRFKKKYWPHLSYKECLSTWNSMYEEQNGKCYICQSPGRLDVDHDHVTKVVRRLICNHCNTALARIRENPNIALKLIEYIHKYNNYATIKKN